MKPRSPKANRWKKERDAEQKPDHRANKRLGQHFLISRSVLETIVSAAELSPEDIVLEIGPGRGVLTQELAKRVHRVIAVEKDPVLAHDLRAALVAAGIANVTIITGDILKIPFRELGLPRGYSVVANIPYYLTSRLIRILLASAHQPRHMTLMVQREVAERIIAAPPRMNLLALAVQSYGSPNIIARVPAESFRPKPKVDSAILKISEISNRFFREHHVDVALFFAVLRAAFSQKRKKLSNSLAKQLGGKSAAEALLSTIGLPKNARPEELSLADWAKAVATTGFASSATADAG